MTRRFRGFAPLVLSIVAACSGGAEDGPWKGGGQGFAGEDPSAGGDGPYADEQGHCVDEINRYRKTIGREPLQRSGALETFATKAASADGQSSRAHGYFMETRGGGVSMAENAIPGWPLKSFGTVKAVLEGGLEGMWNEGPGGGHYENMAHRNYREVGCGFYVTSKNEVWAVQEFR